MKNKLPLEKAFVIVVATLFVSIKIIQLVIIYKK